MKNRKLTVYSGTVGYNLIPKIILQGNWLDDLGFSIGDKIGVSCQQDKITVERIPEDQAQQTQTAEPETGGRQRKGNKNGRYKKVLEEAQKLKWSIESLLKLSGFEQNGDLSGLPIDHEDGKQLFLIGELQQIMEKLSDVDQKLKYLSIPVKEVSRLHKNRRGRYETSGGHSYTSGQGIEVLVPDSRPDGDCWVRTRVEHDGKDYYLVGYHDVCMEGLTVRIREGV